MPDPLLKIGEFARICAVSTQTLRYYDTVGLLPADEIDHFTGYRYYHLDKLETFHRIRTFKEIGFSLDEIKLLLGKDCSARKATVLKRRRELVADFNATRIRLSLLQELVDEETRTREVPLSEWRSLPFEDDEAVPGHWVLIGRQLAQPYDDPPPPECPLADPDEDRAVGYVPREMFLLAGGKPWWMLMWTRGVIYRIVPRQDALIRNPYTLWERDGEVYMTLHYAGQATLSEGGDPLWLLYRRVRHGDIPLSEARARTDDIDLPMIPDLAVIGRWDTVDFVHTPDRFDPRSLRIARAYMELLGLDMTPDGVAHMRLSQGGQSVVHSHVYTRTSDGEHRGAILDRTSLVAEEYDIRTIGEDEYLFLRFKSGDYIYGGMEQGYYVFRRVSRTPSTDKSAPTVVT